MARPARAADAALGTSDETKAKPPSSSSRPTRSLSVSIQNTTKPTPGEHTYPTSIGYISLLKHLATLDAFADARDDIGAAVELYEQLTDEPDASRADYDVWATYTRGVHVSLRKREPGVLKSGQAIGYAEVLGERPTMFLLVWKYNKGVGSAEWISWDDINQVDWNEYADHFVHDAFHFAPSAPRFLPFDKPRIALLPGLEDCREEFTNDLKRILETRLLPVDFEGGDETQSANGDKKPTLPWPCFELLESLKSIPRGVDARYKSLREKLNDFYKTVQPLSYFNDTFESNSGPIVVGRAIEVVPGAEEDRVWWLKLDSPTQDAKNGVWTAEPDAGLEDTFTTDALLRYGCTVDPFTTRDTDAQPRHRSICLLNGIKGDERINAIAASLEAAIEAHPANASKKRKAAASAGSSPKKSKNDATASGASENNMPASSPTPAGKGKGKAANGNADPEEELDGDDEGDDEEDEGEEGEEEEEVAQEVDNGPAPPAKRGRGRPPKAKAIDNNPAEPKKGRGRPSKVKTNTEDDAPAQPKRGRGRPPKTKSDAENNTPAQPKRGRGRPSKTEADAKTDSDKAGPSQPKRGRGRPPKRKADTEEDDAGPSQPKRGRPPKAKTDTEAEDEVEGPSEPKRGRGRPPKAKTDTEAEADNAGPSQPKRGRGRPPKAKTGTEAKDDAAGPSQPKRGRGRPPKAKTDAEKNAEKDALAQPKRGRGRPPKSAAAPEPKGPARAATK